MAKTIIAAQLDKNVFDDAQRLIEAGHFASLDELLDAALRTFVLKYEQTRQQSAESLTARTVQAMMAELDGLERVQFEEFVAAYVGVAQHDMNDDDMVSLLEIFNAYGFKRAMAALHDGQDSRVPMSPRYLETILEKSAQPPPSGRAQQSEERPPNRARIGADDPLLADVAGLYEQEIGGLSEKVCEQLKELVAEFPDVQRWHQAFEAAASMNHRNLRYVIGCLKNNGQKVERKGNKRATSKSEQVREQKRKRNQEYDDYWAERLKAKQQQRKDTQR